MKVLKEDDKKVKKKKKEKKEKEKKRTRTLCIESPHLFTLKRVK